MTWLKKQTGRERVKRKRRISQTQRVAANTRERKRMELLNIAFESLRQRIPCSSDTEKLSRIQTLRSAIEYIALMTEILCGY